MNCGDSALETAARTLDARRASLGATNPEFVAWVDAQDLVFSNCARQSNQSLAIPEPLGPSASRLAQADRAYRGRGGAVLRGPIHRMRPRWCSSRQPEVPAALGGQWGGLLEAMTAREPEDRPTAGEVAATLDGLTADAGPASRLGIRDTARPDPARTGGPSGARTVVPAGARTVVPAAPGLEPSGSPAAHGDAPPGRRGAYPVTSRRRHHVAWGLSAAGAATVAALVTVAATS